MPDRKAKRELKAQLRDAHRSAALDRALTGLHSGHDLMLGHVFAAGGRGRKRRGDVRAALLLALSEQPSNGYQLMQTIEERSGGRWRPSPGSVYPTLAQLEDQGFVRATEQDGVKLFELTAAGRKHLESRPDEAPPWEGEEDPATIADLQSQIKQVHIAAIQVGRAGDEQQISKAAETLAETRRKLYRILAEDPTP